MNEFIEAWKDVVLKNYANFSGRLGRGGYWRFVAVNVAIVIVGFILTRIASILVILLIGFYLAVLIPSLAAGFRRLHDTGKSGWMILISLVPLVGGIILLVFLVQPGQPAPNAYGPPPVGAGSSTMPSAVPPPPPPPAPPA
jgi:uncharacterized membrane protein YhaH (DUF805 family)